jgi:large subunit ribosomal protein L44e
VNIPKTKKAFCAAKPCQKHQVHKVTQYKAGKAKLYVQGTKHA